MEPISQIKNPIVETQTLPLQVKYISIATLLFSHENPCFALKLIDNFSIYANLIQFSMILDTVNTLK